MGVMRRAAALVAVLALAGADASAKDWPLYGLVSNRSSISLVRLDPLTLERLPGRQLRLGTRTSAAALVRGGDLALADDATLQLIDLGTMRRFGTVRLGFGAGAARAVAWSDWRWIVVVRGGQGLIELVAVDRSVMKVARRTFVKGSLVAYERSESELVLLVAPMEGIGAARLVVVDPEARTREIMLERVTAGSRCDHDTATEPTCDSRTPALAVDPTRRIAYVVTADGVVADVALEGATRYHAVRGRYAKTVSGSWRRAEWLGGGILAVAGSDSVDGRRSEPSGLELVDTRTWTSRLVLRGAANVVRWRDGVLATGTPWDAERGALPGIGVVYVGRDGTERFRVGTPSEMWIAAATPTRAYAYAQRHVYVLDALTGTSTAVSVTSWPWLLPAQESFVWP